jgi:DNA-binding NarL/FixJ family response regulator
MVPERDRELLTAYVDGVLSSRQRRHVVKLLKRSRDARRLLSQLQADSASLIALPAVPKLDVDLSRSVEQKIRERRLSPRPRPVVPVAKPMPAWVGLAIAASVLVVLGLASYFGFGAYFSRHGNQPATPLVKKDEERVPEREPTPTPQEKPNDRPEERQPPHREFVGPLPEKLMDDPTPIVMNPPEFVGPLKPDDPRVEALTDRPIPAKERFSPERVEAGPRPFIKELQLIQQDGVRAELLDFLKHGDGFRIELPSGNGTQALDRLQAACKDQKLTVLVEPTAQRRHKMTQAKTNYVLYVENLSPEELTALLQSVAAEDHKSPRFTGLVVRQLTRTDDKVLSGWLGIDVNELAPAKGDGPLGTDVTRPLPEQTADQIAKALVKGGEKQVLVMAYNPVEPTKNSPEMKRFLDSRRTAKPDAVRALIVLRSL